MLAQQIINGITQGSLFALLAISFAIVYGTLRLVNFATGSLYMIGAYTSFYVVRHVSSNLFVSLAIAAVVGFVMGLILERLAFKSLRGVSRIASLICTIGFSLFLNELAAVVFGRETRVMPSVHTGTAFRIAGTNIIWLQVIMILVAAVIVIGLQLLLFKTKMGLSIRAVSLDYKTAGLMGINVDRTISFAFGLASACAGVAGVLAAFYYNSVFPVMGTLPGLKSFSAAVFGGLTSIPGAILGGYLLGVIENLAVQVISSGYRDIVGFIILVVFLLVRPRGLLGRKIPM